MVTFKGFPEAVDDLESGLNGKLGLGDDDIILLAKECPAFRVAQNDPFQPHVFKMLGTDLSGVCTITVVRSILSRHSVG
jgi:hypothetical protein